MGLRHNIYVRTIGRILLIPLSGLYARIQIARANRRANR